MKKLFYLLAFSSLPVCLLHAQTKTNSLDQDNLKGYVKSVNEIKFDAAEKFGDVTKGKKQDRHYDEFNKSGFRTEALRKDYEDDSEWKIKLEYDGNNNPVELYENDEGEIETSKRKFNAQGLVEEDTFDKKGKLTGKAKFKNNSSGLQVQMVEYDADGKLTYTLENKYNANNQLISSLGYDEPGKLLYSNYYKYDIRGNIIEDIYGSRNKKGSLDIVTHTYRFNSKKQKLEETYSSGGDKPSKTTYEYDTNGNLLAKNDSYNNQDTYTYTYDKQNNWIKRIKSHQSYGTKTFEITEREIKYYDEKDIPASAKKKIESNGYSYFEDMEFDLKPGPVAAPLWRFIYTRGEGLGEQRRRAMKEFTEKEIREDMKEGYYITGLSYDGNVNNKKFVMIISKTKFTDQAWKISNNKGELEAAIKSMRKDRPDLYISSIAFADGKWIAVSSKGTGYTEQITSLSVAFPEASIKEYGGKGYSITDMAYGGGLWVVVMSKGTNTFGQHYTTRSDWDQKLVDDNAAKNYYLTETVKYTDKLYMVFTQKNNISYQDIEATEAIPEKQTLSKWEKGYEISATFYY